MGNQNNPLTSESSEGIDEKGLKWRQLRSFDPENKSNFDNVTKATKMKHVFPKTLEDRINIDKEIHPELGVDMDGLMKMTEVDESKLIPDKPNDRTKIKAILGKAKRLAKQKHE